jgi:methylmalonyl-CoA carboxyltransferase large subunit
MGAFLFTLIGGAVAGALTSRYVVRREMAALREMLQERPAPPARIAAPTQPAPAPIPIGERISESPAPDISEEITPEILMVLSAAVAAFFGKKARIRRARAAGPAEQGSVWAQQGRVFVQASHNLAR